MARYAARTTVTAGNTEAEIKQMLTRRGITRIATFTDDLRYDIAFEREGAAYRISLPMPDPNDKAFTEYYRGSVLYARTESAAQELYDKEVNRRWRAFGAVIKAKIIAVEEGISTFEREFIGQLVIRGGRTIAETYGDNVSDLASAGYLPALPMPGGSR